MSDIFAMTDQAADDKLAAARANSVDSLADITAPWYRGIGTGAFSGVMRGGAKAGDFLATFGKFFDEPSATEQEQAVADVTRERADAIQEDLRHSAIDAWTPRANEVGRAGQIVGGLGEVVLPLAATGGNPTLLVGSQTLAGGKELVDQGVDADTAAKAAAIEGVAAYAGLKVPIAGSTLASRMLTGAVGNVVVGAVSRVAEGSALSAYPEQAKAFATTPEAVTTDALTGLLFGGAAHIGSLNPRLTPTQRDAVMTARNAKMFQEGTAPGVPENIRAEAAHPQAMEASLGNLAADRANDIGDVVARHEGAGFKPGPQIEAAREAGQNVVDGLPKDVPYDPELDLENFGATKPPITLPDEHPLLVPRETDMSPERVALRDDIVARQVADAKTVEGRKPIATLMGGGGASGKGTILRFLEERGFVKKEGAVHIDPDELKAEIPEYKKIIAAGDSRAAAVVHEESSALAKRVLEAAIQKRADIVLDRTLADPMKAMKEIKMLRAAGYEVHLKGVTVDPVNAVRRADRRARRTMRFVPPRELLKAHKGFAAGFEKLAAEADSAVLYDNEVPEGSAPRMLASVESGKSLKIHDENGYNVFRQRSQINEQGTTARAVRAGVGATLAAGRDSGGDAGDARANARGDEGQPGSSRGPPASRGVSGQGVEPPVSRLSLADALAAKPGDNAEAIPELETLRQWAEANPDTTVYVGSDADGNPVKTTVAAEYERIKAEYEQDIRDTGAYEAAAGCLLGAGI